ncbi:MAG: hemolysin III family protein [Calditrichaeota bacterium]|nr:MAG: hemolysin III family protein [Calditrichota bacterium]
MNRKSAQYGSFGEELANSISHGFGVVLSIAGLVVLIIAAATHGTVWHLVSFSIFGSTLIILYLASTLYHSIPKLAWKRILKKFDHAAIFLLIAGSYTPFMLVNLRGAWGWSMFGVIWGLAITGVVLKMFFAHKYAKISTAIYVIMGWLCVIAFKQMLMHVPVFSLKLLIAGGLSYTGGVVFYVWKRLPYNHAIWHGFVLGGSILHFFSVLNIV